ncbi:MAG: quinol monooxygenase YgiN [Phenylobacterium sp.]|jgi:quinol monooxygenase YgiN
MSNSLTLLVQIQAKADQADTVKAALLNLLEPTRAEAGCVSYELYFDDKDATKFIFVETWQTRAHWEAHNTIDHLQPFFKLAETAVENVIVTDMTKAAHSSFAS